MKRFSTFIITSLLTFFIFSTFAGKIVTFDFVNNTYGLTRETDTDAPYIDSGTAITTEDLTVVLDKVSGNGFRLWKDGLRVYTGTLKMTYKDQTVEAVHIYSDQNIIAEFTNSNNSNPYTADYTVKSRQTITKMVVEIKDSGSGNDDPDGSENPSRTTFTDNGFHFQVISDNKRTCEVVDWDCDHDPSRYDTIRPYVLNVPSTAQYNGVTYEVVAIAEDAFCLCYDCIGALYTGDNVTRIGNNAFTMCSKLWSVGFGEKLSEIGENAFYDCHNIEELTIPNIHSLTKIGNNAFNGVASLASINKQNSFVCGKNLREIGDNAFQDCISLASVDFSNSSNLTIGNNAFQSCLTLKQLELTPGIKSIGEQAFINCTGIKRISFSTPATKIGAGAFALCSSLTNIELPNSLDNFDYGTFYNCTALQSIYIPNGVTSIPAETFLQCSNLKEITFFPLSVQDIGKYAFAETNISAVYLPKFLQKVSYGAFYSTPLSLVVLNPDLSSIEDYAFYSKAGSGNPALYATGEVPPSLGQNVFYNPSKWTVYTDPAHKQKYLNATNDWVLFKDFFAYEIPESITLSSSNLFLTAGEKARLKLNFNYSTPSGDSSPLNCFWSVPSNPDVAYFDPQYSMAVMVSGSRDTQAELYFHTYFESAPLICYINKPTDDASIITADNETSNAIFVYDLKGRYIGNSVADLAPGIYIISSETSKPRKIIIR